LRAVLAAAVPQASLDDHRVWAARIGTMASSVVVLGVALFVLVILAMAMAIGFATRSAMAGNREIIEVLHFVGASEAFIANEFQRHFRRLAFRGAFIGGSAAFLLFLAAAGLSNVWAHSPGGAEVAAMFGAFALGAIDYIALALIGAGVTLLTGFLSRKIVFWHLRALQ
jgi:cell division transport system permease protein